MQLRRQYLLLVVCILSLIVVGSGCNREPQPEESSSSPSSSQEEPLPPEINLLQEYMDNAEYCTLARLPLGDCTALLFTELEEEYTDLFSYNTQLKIALLDGDGEVFDIIETGSAVYLSSTSQSRPPALEPLEFEQRDGYQFCGKMGVYSWINKQLYHDGRQLLLFFHDGTWLDRYTTHYILLDKTGVISRHQLPTVTEYTSFMEDGASYNHAAQSITLGNEILSLTASPEGIVERINTERWMEIQSSLDCPPIGQVKREQLYPVYDPTALELEGLIVDTAMMGSDQRFATLEDAPDRFFTDNLLWYAPAALSFYEEHPDYALIQEVMGMRGCGDCYIPIGHVERYIQQKYGIQRSLKDYVHDEDTLLYFDDALRFFYLPHIGWGPPMPSVCAYQQEEDGLIRAHVYYLHYGTDWFGRVIGRDLDELARARREEEATHEYTFRRDEEGVLRIVSHQMGKAGADFPLFETDLTPFQDGSPLPAAPKDHPLYDEVNTQLQRLTSHSWVPEFDAESGFGQGSFNHDPYYQVFMVALQDNAALVREGKGVSRELQKELQEEAAAAGWDYATFVRQPDVYDYGLRYFGESFDGGPHYDSQLGGFTSDSGDMFLTVYSEELINPGSINLSHILSINESNGEITVRALSLTLSPYTNAVYSSVNQAVGYLDDIAVRSFAAVVNWPDHILLQEQPAETVYVFVRGSDGGLQLKTCR